MREVERAAIVSAELKKTIPETRVELDYTNALELMVATVLSAQCTDVKVNEVTADLLKKYRRAPGAAEAKGGINYERQHAAGHPGREEDGRRRRRLPLPGRADESH